MWPQALLAKARSRIGEILGRRTKEHRFAHDYWTNCSNSFLASDPTYYDRQEVALREILSALSASPTSALDIGCGNGRFSFVMAELAREVTACDLAPQLIDQARAEQNRRNVSNLRFYQHDLEQGLPKGPYDLVSCMGVVSTLIDDVVVDALLDEIASSTSKRGFLVTKDTLSAASDGKLYVSDTYVTRYRTVSSYEQSIAQRGYVLLERRQMAVAEAVINYLYLWQRA